MKVYSLSIPCCRQVQLLHCPISFQHYQYGLQQDFDIQPNIPVADIFFVQVYDYFEICDIAATAHLPHTGKTRAKAQTDLMVLGVLLVLFPGWRSGSHKAHITFQDIPELW